MASLDLTSFDDVLKIHYSPQRVQNMVYRDEPFLAILPKYTKFGGRSMPIPIQFSVIGGRSQAFTNAQNNTYPSSFGEFSLTRVRDYAIAHIDNETMMASQGDQNSFLRASTTEINSAFRAITRSIASALFRNGTGSIGRITTAGTGIADGSGEATFRLATADDITNFEVGMTLVAAATETGTPRGGGEGTGYRVIRVNRSTADVTVTGTAVATSSWAEDDYIFVQGDAYGGASANRKVSGLDAWIPSTDPTSTLFFGQNRALDPTRLGGVRYDASSLTIEEGLIDAAARLGREGGRPDRVVLNPTEWARLAKELGGRIVYDRVASSNGAVSFRSIVLATPKGDVQIMSDHNCPSGRAYMLQMDTWKLYSLGEVPMVLNYDDGAGSWLRRSSADGVELRVGYYAQLGCDAPGFNCRITLPA